MCVCYAQLIYFSPVSQLWHDEDITESMEKRDKEWVKLKELALKRQAYPE